MSAQLAPRPVREATPRPRLRAVDAPRVRPATLPFVVVMVVILAVGMAGMVVLTTALQGQAHLVTTKQHEATVLANRVSQLKAQLADTRSITHLANAAQGLGMRPNPQAMPMRLSDGKVLGTARPVLGNEVPSVRYLSDAEVAAEVAAIHQAEMDRIARQQAATAARKAAAAANQAADDARGGVG